jgi:hemoglobin/transferrin/lactoferrin receptor protein
VNLGYEKIASLTSVSYKKLGDSRMGQNRNPFYEDLGLVYHYTDFINGSDTILENDKEYVQKKTGYNQFDAMQKLSYKLNEFAILHTNFQFSTSSNIDRFDQLTQYADTNILKFAEWHYGPQNRFLASSSFEHKKSNTVYDYANILFAYQNIVEERIWRRYQNEKRYNNTENVNVASVNIDLYKNFNSGKLNYGSEYRYNFVNSQGHTQNIFTGERESIISRYPDKGSITHDASVYAAYKWKPRGSFSISLGTRYNLAYLKSKFDLNSTLFKLPFNVIEFTNHSFTAALSGVYHPANDWKISAVLSNGFRNPNVDDVGKIREKNGELLIPNSDVKPEYSYNAEMGFSKTFDGYIQFNATVFATYLLDAIVRENYVLNGEAYFMVDSVEYLLQTNSNASKASGARI